MDDSSEKGNQVCVILGLGYSIGIFTLNLESQYQRSKSEADANGFVKIRPNLQVDLSFFPHVVKDTLYLFDDYAFPRSRVPPRVYSIQLQQLSDMSDFRAGMKEVRSETKFTRLHDCLAGKTNMMFLSYRDSILVFSTQIGIHYYYYDDENENGDTYIEGFHNLNDFELYHPGEGKSEVLPQLIVCLPRSSAATNRLKLYDADASSFYDPEFCAFRGFTGIYYSIVSFGLDVEEDTFVIETDFGRTFSLKLDGSDECWRLCDEGYEFVRDSHNVVFSNGICLHARGANDSRKKWLELVDNNRRQKQNDTRRDGDDASQSHSQKLESPRRLGFPPFPREIESCNVVSARGRDSSEFDFLKLNGGDPSFKVCTVSQGFDPIDYKCHSSSNSYFFLDVLKLNMQNLEEEFPDEEFPDNYDDKFMEKMRSFKFFVPGKTYNPVPFVPGVFYY